MNTLKSYQSFPLECGYVLHELDIAYHTYGKLNEAKNNVVWIFHALTANADAADWWEGLVGENKLLDTEKYFIVCANMLGSCYGATNANSVNPLTGKRYGKDFPIISIRDVVKSHEILRKHLNINKIYFGIGGSMGGQQVLEWSIIAPDLFENICVLAAGAKAYPWSIGINETQRMALEADATLYDDAPDAGKKGLEAARAIGLLSFRNPETYNRVQKDDDEKNTLEDFRVKTYQRYQGQKLSNRFTALSYLSITRTMDTHHVGRLRGGIKNALQLIKANVLVIGIQSDLLYAVHEQIELASLIPNAQLEIIDSPYGHDGFLIETEKITIIITAFLNANLNKKNTSVLDLEKNLQPMLLCA
jgi:homoserine O-acetyltransferase/O-succinyltransferase